VLRVIILYLCLGSIAMAKLVGRTKGLDQRKLKALEKLLKEAGVSGDVKITSGLRDHDEVFRIYNKRIRREKLDKIMPELSKKSKDMINQMILRSDYKGKDSPVDIKYSRSEGINKIKKQLEDQLKKEGLSSIKAKAISGKVQSIRKDFGGFESSHLKGGKIDIPQSALSADVVQRLKDKGYNIIKEDKVGIYDIAFPKSGVKGSVKTVGKKPKPKSVPKTDMENKFLIPEDKSLIPQWMKKHGYRSEDMKRPDGSWYNPGEAMEPVDPRFENVEEFEEFKEQETIEPEVSPMGKQIEGVDIEAPKPDFILPDAPPPNPYGVYAKGEPEFEMAEEEQKVMMAANGGEVQEDFSMEEQISEAVPTYLQRPEEGQQEESFKLEGIDDIVEGLDEVSAQAGQEELQKADEIIQEDVGEQDDLGEQMAAFRSGEAESFEEESTPQDSWMEEQVEKTEKEKIGRDPYLSETHLTRTKEGIPGYIIAGDMEGLIRARDSKKFNPTAIEREIGRRKKNIQQKAGLKRPPSIEDIIKIEKSKDVAVDEGLKDVVKGPKVPKGDVSKREPSVRVTSDVEKQQSALERQKAELDAKIQEFQKTESKYDAIDNQRFFNKGGTLNKIISMVAAGFGGYASGRFGGPNVYLDLIDKEVKSDIQQQKLDREDEVAKQNAAYKKIKQLADRYKMAVDNDFAQKKLDLLSKKMDQKVAANRNKLAVQNLKQQDYSRITKPLSRKDFTALDFKYPKMKLRDRAMTGRDGQVYIVDSADTKKKLEEQIENNTGAVQAIDQLVELTPKLSMFEKFPGAGRFSVNRKLADATRDALVGKLRLELFGPGVMTDTEREQAKMIIGDPGALFEMDKTKIAALQNIRWKLKYAERERLRRSGVQVPMSPNDLKVENRLKNLGYPPFAKASPKQKRIAMDILINAEKAAMRKAKAGNPPKGYYKGKFWDKDEQGNF